MNMMVVQNPKDLVLVSKNGIHFLVSYVIIIIFLLKSGVFFLKLVHAVLTDEQPKATFIPKNNGRTSFKIHTNEPGCGYQNECTLLAWKNPQGPKEPKTNQTFPNNNDDDDNNNSNNNNNNSNNNNNNSNNN